jgi:transcription elongation factor Elf1
MKPSDRIRHGPEKQMNCTCCGVASSIVRGAVNKQGLFICGLCALRDLENVLYWVDVYFDRNGNYRQ